MIPAARFRTARRRISDIRVGRGMIKTADQLITNGAWTLVTGLTANTADFPGSAVVTNGLVVSGGGSYVVKAYGRFDQANTSNHRLQVLVNGVAVGTVYLSGSPSQTAQFGGDQTMALADGDLVQLQAWATSGTSNRRTMYGHSDKTGTYLELVPA